MEGEKLRIPVKVIKVEPAPKVEIKIKKLDTKIYIK